VLDEVYVFDTEALGGGTDDAEGKLFVHIRASQLYSTDT
jgi:hypothetical protein